jgi:hypothetical protein
MERWVDPPDVPAPRDLMAIQDPVDRADAAHRALRRADDYRSWLVRARAEAIAAAYARRVPYAYLGEHWGVSGERVRQMMFQSGDGRSGWYGGVESATPAGRRLMHAMRGHDDHAACGCPTISLGADFTATIYPVCKKCREIVRDELATRGD